MGPIDDGKLDTRTSRANSDWIRVVDAFARIARIALPCRGVVVFHAGEDRLAFRPVPEGRELRALDPVEDHCRCVAAATQPASVVCPKGDDDSGLTSAWYVVPLRGVGGSVVGSCGAAFPHPDGPGAESKARLRDLADLVGPRLAVADDLRAVEAQARRMLHDLRSPLGVIKMAVDQLVAGPAGPVPNDRARILDILERNVGLACSMVAQDAESEGGAISGR